VTGHGPQGRSGRCEPERGPAGPRRQTRPNSGDRSSTPGGRTPVERLATLAAEADAAFGAIHARHPDRMQCRAGCSACCRARLSITRVEAAFLRSGLAAFSPGRRSELAARTREIGREPCPALDDDGRCGVYAFRPLICRSYGVPLRHRREVALVNPPVVDACDLNFVGTDLRTLPDEDVYDQSALEAALESIDRDHCSDHGLPQRERILLADLLA
jgi:hypothetical protein